MLRYASGYVPMKLMRFAKQRSNKAASFVECLSHMAIDGPESSLEDYTTQWVKIVNRGGPFEISDSAYNLLHCFN